MGKEEFIKIIREFSRKVRVDFKIDKVIFFGSRTGKRYNDYSDIDLIIVSDDFKGMNFIDRAANMYNYWSFDVPVDFICYTPVEFRALKNRISVVSEALKNGIII